MIGDNGAGKSSLIKCLSGAMVPDEGSIALDGQSISFKRPRADGAIISAFVSTNAELLDQVNLR